ncbi:hypothetical protein Pmani_021766 [Petrolisthes manimaculis]|uniref:Elongator complex protein 1 n=1 Tax=Petrolisthes manimaculis TaxID=1843537 RepID=A0AAE1U4Z5_9EUCA|nr:hypothetical protein Pmani_021766 [Petrolisthes manimaculis]
MRNLVLNEDRRQCVDVVECGCLCVDPITHSIYHVNTQGVQPLSNVCDSGGGFTGVTWMDHDVTTSVITQADVLTASNVICVITQEGDVVTVNIDSHQVETVGSVSAGVYGAHWSPDQELLALVTGENNLVVMTAEFDPIADIPLNQDDFGENKFINVGWGKKETQFHGSEGKEAARKTERSGAIKSVSSWDDRKPRISWRGDGQLLVVSHVTKDTQTRRLKIVSREGVLQATSEPIEGLEQCLDWRPSGNLIASSQRLTHKLGIILFEKNGLSHGEFSVPYKPEDVFVKEVLWNQDSSVLLVWLQPLPTPDANTKKKFPQNIVQLWTTSNYHWYLKQELTFKELSFLCWDTETSHLLHVLTTTHLYRYNWVSTEHVSLGSGHNNLSCVAVVDGRKICITPFRQTLIPPPMSAYEITFPEPVRSLMFAPTTKFDERTKDYSPNSSTEMDSICYRGHDSNDMCVFHGSDTLTLLTLANVSDIQDINGCTVKVLANGQNGFAVNFNVHKISTQYKIVCNPDIKLSCIDQLYNWTWATHNTILACYSEDSNNFVVILEVEGTGIKSEQVPVQVTGASSEGCKEIDGTVSKLKHRIEVEGSESRQVIVKEMLPVEDLVVTVVLAPDGSCVALQLVSGALLKLDLLSRVIEPYTLNGDEIVFPSMCKTVCLCPVDEGSQLIPLGLSNWNRLYFGKDQLFANCTSFVVHNNHLLATTTDHKLQIVPLTSTIFRKLVEGKASENGLVASRKIERGAKIVTAIPQDTRVVLQMPRGNLEVISPRALAIHTLKQLLNEHMYHQAIDIMRKQRIDLNLVYDHNPSDFLVHVTHFVQDVNNSQWIDLFLASLSEVDVTKTMYSFNYIQDQNRCNLNWNNMSEATGDASTTQSAGTKIDKVCAAVRKAMIAVDEERYLPPILTSHVKMTPSQMDVALTKLKKMKDTHDRQDFQVSAEVGLRHLLYISDVNELYNVALGTYDFDLVMMIAEKSQKDPKEYLPFLNQLRAMEDHYRKYKINVYLRRFKTALEYIQNTTDHNEECLDLIKSEKLYREALQVFPASSCMTQLVCECYGNYLMSKNLHSEAAVMFSRANQLESALNAYRLAGMWRMVVIVAEQLRYDKAAMQELCLSLVKSLKNRNKFQDAALLYENYLRNEEEALECLVKANEWEEAQRVAQRYQRWDLVDTHIKPGVLEHYEFCMMEIERLTTTLTQSVERLAKVRETKQQQQLDLLEGNAIDGQLDSDLYSDTSTVTGASLSRSLTSGSSRPGSSTSTRTYRSTKSKKKLERKKYSTKEGSPYEDLGLVAALHEIFTAADTMVAGVTSLCTMLVTFKFDQQATLLQRSVSHLLSIMERKKNEIWPSDSAICNDMEFGPDLTTDGALSQMMRDGGGVSRKYTLALIRMRELEPHLRHVPVPTRSDNWSLHMLKDTTDR